MIKDYTIFLKAGSASVSGGQNPKRLNVELMNCLPGRCYAFELRLPKPLAPTGAASQSYQLAPVADLLLLRENSFSTNEMERRLPSTRSIQPLFDHSLIRRLFFHHDSEVERVA